MKVGDLVQKTDGDLNLNEMGVIVEIVTNDVGNTILTVSSDRGLRKWLARLVEVISEPNM